MKNEKAELVNNLYNASIRHVPGIAAEINRIGTYSRNHGLAVESKRLSLDEIAKLQSRDVHLSENGVLILRPHFILGSHQGNYQAFPCNIRPRQAPQLLQAIDQIAESESSTLFPEGAAYGKNERSLAKAALHYLSLKSQVGFTDPRGSPIMEIVKAAGSFIEKYEAVKLEAVGGKTGAAQSAALLLAFSAVYNDASIDLPRYDKLRQHLLTHPEFAQATPTEVGVTPTTVLMSNEPSGKGVKRFVREAEADRLGNRLWEFIKK